MRLESVFPKRVITAAPDCRLVEIAGLMEEHEVGTVVIVERDRPVGIVTDRDLALELGTGRAVRSEPVRVIMTSPVATIGCHEGILNATWRMHDNGVRRLPIVDDDGRVVGLLSLDDLLLLLGREIGNLVGGVKQELRAGSR